MRRNRRLVLLGIFAVCLVLTACGSRRPLSDFVAAANGSTSGSGSTQAAAGGPAATNGGPVAGGPSAGPGAAPAAGGPTGVTSSTGPGSSSTTTNGSSSTTGTTGSGKTGNTPNTASDVGVTPTQIYLGDVFTKSGSFGPYQFTSMYYGAATYFSWLNDHGGINGRKVVLEPCDDGGKPTQNQNCVHKLIGSNNKSSGVFAFVAEDCLACDGLKYMSQQKVPEVGGVAIDFKDYAYPNTWRYDGNPYPANGSIGYNHQLYQGTQQFRWFKDKLGVTKVGVIYYSSSAASQAAGQAFADGARHEGMQVTEYAENVALPQWNSDVLDMKARGIQALWDTLDVSGNQNLCKAIDSNKLVLKAKVSTISTWSQAVGTTFDYPCRSYIYSVDQPGTLGYDQTSNPEVATFRQAFAHYFPNLQGQLAEWTLDGWASAMWFSDAAKSCGANLTRVCLEKYLNKPYSAHGLWWPRSNIKYNFSKKPYAYHQCIVVAKWDEQKKSFQTVADYHNTCSTTPYLPYQPPPQ